jgi:DNA-binding NtrC family response regulator
VTITLPPLRDRPRDIPALADHFIRKYAEANGLPPLKLSAATEAMLMAHPWRGNVRELENTMHRAVLLGRGSELGPEAILLTGQRTLPGSEPAAAAAEGQRGAAAPAAPLVGRTVAAVERDLIIETLNHCLGNRTHAANILGISIRTLRNKLKQYSAEGTPLPGRGGDAERQAV